MIIVHVTTVHSSDDPRIFRKECMSLLQAGYDVHIVCSELPKSVNDQLHYHVIGKYKSRLKRIFFGVPKAFFSSLRTRATVVHFHDPELLPLSIIWRILGKQVIYDIHEDYVTSIKQKKYLPSVLRLPLAILVGGFEKYAAFCCKKVIAEKYYAERFSDAISVLNYPISNDFYSGHIAPIVNLSKDYSWCLYTGRVSQDRGAYNHINVLINNSNIGLCVIGKCDSRMSDILFEKIDKLGIKRDRLVIIGKDRYVPKTEMNAIVRNNSWLAALALFPESDHYVKKELTKLFEYMQDGIPIIASKFPSWIKLLEECEVGILVNPSNNKEIEEAIDWMIKNPEKRHRMSDNGRRIVRENYNWRNEACKLIDLYRKIESRLNN